MLIESDRALILPVSPERAVEALLDPARLAALVPEIEGASASGTSWYLHVRLGWRRRGFVARRAKATSRSLELASATPGVEFSLLADVEPHPEGCRVHTRLKLRPPERWLRARGAVLASRELARRLVVSTTLFALAAAGVLLIPSQSLPRWGAALAWALTSVLFVAAVAMLSGTHRRGWWLTRTRGLPAPLRPRASHPGASA